MTDSMTCPVGRTEMVNGQIVARSPGPKFRTGPSLLMDVGGIGFTSGLMYQKADAFRCEACGTIVVPGSV